MKILEDSTARLRLGYRTWLTWLPWTLCFMIVIASCIFLVLEASPAAWKHGNHVDGVTSILFGCLLLPVMVGTFFAVVIRAFRNIEYQFDRQSGDLRVIERRWLRRSVQCAHYPLADIAGVSVIYGTEYSPSPDYNYDYDLEINTWSVEVLMQSRETLKLYKETKPGGQDAERLAEAIAQFLVLPLIRA